MKLGNIISKAIGLILLGVVFIGFGLVFKYDKNEKKIGYETHLLDLKSNIEKDKSIYCLNYELVQVGIYVGPVYRFLNVYTEFNNKNIKYLDDYFIVDNNDERRKYHVDNCFKELNLSENLLKKPKPDGFNKGMQHYTVSKERSKKIKEYLAENKEVFCRSTTTAGLHPTAKYKFTSEEPTKITSLSEVKFIEDYDQFYIELVTGKTFNVLNCFGAVKDISDIKARNNIMYNKNNK